MYDATKGWYLFEVPPDIDSGGGGREPGARFWNETFPPSLFAIVPPAPSWLHGNVAKSRGYLDDACDGFVFVALTLKGGKRVTAYARITSGPPMLVPDARFVRSLADDLEQALLGPAVPEDEPVEVTRARAEEIVRRAFETVRFLNIAFMNGEPYQGRSALDFDTMPAEEAFDTARLMRPVMAAGSVDTLGVMALHQQVFAALRGGAAPWFERLLRRPEEVVDYTDDGRRKMPALMCGADGSYLALTHRQIDTIGRVASTAPFEDALGGGGDSAVAHAAQPDRPAGVRRGGQPGQLPAVGGDRKLLPGPRSRSSAPSGAGSSKGSSCASADNLVVATDESVTDPVILGLVGCRLLRVNGVETMGTMVGPSPADPAEPVELSTIDNPYALAPLEWSNALAHVLHDNVGRKVPCDFTKITVLVPPAAVDGEREDYRTVELELRPVFEPGTAVLSGTLVEPGELTQGLCSPWQNDFRECSCYYWASARPDFVNVAPSPTGSERRRQLAPEGANRPVRTRRLRRRAADRLRRPLPVLGALASLPDRRARRAGGRGVTGVAELIDASRPRSPDAHLVTGDGAGHLFLPDGSRLFDLDPDLLEEVERALETGAVTALLDRLQLREVRYVDDAPLDPPPVHALSLAVAQKCNLGCTYCYAQGGEFGGAGHEHAARGRARVGRPAPRRRRAGRARQPRVPRRRAAGQPRRAAAATAARRELGRRARRRAHLLDHHQRHPPDRGRRASSSRSTASP